MSFTTLIRKYYYFIGFHHRILRDDNLDDDDAAMKRDDDDDVVVHNGNGCHRRTYNNSNSSSSHATPAASKQEWWNIGGPNTILPQWMESFLCWSLALSCLSISGYHYIIDNYIRTTNNNNMTITTTNNNNNNRMMTTTLYRNVVLLGLQDYILHPIRRLFLGRSYRRRRPIDKSHPQYTSMVSPKSKITTSPLESPHPSHPSQVPQPQLQFPCWIPLMTFSRAELQRGTPYERYIQLIQVLEYIHPTCLLLCQVQNNNNNNNNNNYSNETIIMKYHSDRMMVQCCTTLSDDEFILLIRQNEIVRRLVSLALRPSCGMNTNDDDVIDVRQLPIGQQCIRIWLQLLTLPPIQQQQLCPIQRRMMDYDNPNSSDNSSSSTALNNDDVNRPITTTTTTTTTKQQQQLVIALIIPCYQETTNDIIDKLNDALHHCDIPQRVQVRLVMAGKKKKKNTIMIDQLQELQLALLLPTKVHSEHKNDTNHHVWGDIQIIEFLEESGRGPCLNYGATYDERSTTGNQKNHHSNNNILVYTFCHSDTRLPYHWDETLIQTLYPSPPPPSTSPSNHHKRINACAYRFGIDTSTLNKKNRRSYPPVTHHDNHNDDTTTRNDYYPPGIHAIEVTANLRCTFWSLPYGDQCISMRANDFHYIGGFPHQCLMEDYELVTLLRKRMKLLPLFHRHPSSSDIVQQQEEEEVLQILSGPPVLCSPRRWQKFGVFYVTYTNSRLVQLYNQKNKNHPNVMTSPEDIYQLYYGQRLDVIAPKSPWEIELEHILNKPK